MRVLQTDRLVLRWFTADDASFVVELLNDAAWLHLIGDRGVRSEADARAWIDARLRAPYWRQGFGQWAIERRSDGARLGICGLIRRDALPDIDLGYSLLPRFHGMGYAREAAAAVLAYADEVLGLSRILAITDPANERSISLLQSLGMVLERTAVLAGDDDPSMVFAWGPPAGPGPQASAPLGAQAEIDALVHRFYRAFDNANGRSHHVAAVPYYFTPDARILRIDGDRLESHDLPAFIAAQAAVLDAGRLIGFSEIEHHHLTEVEGRLAQRSSRCRKTGHLDGVSIRGERLRVMQFVRSMRGWHISAMAWQDRG